VTRQQRHSDTLRQVDQGIVLARAGDDEALLEKHKTIATIIKVHHLPESILRGVCICSKMFFAYCFVSVLPIPHHRLVRVLPSTVYQQAYMIPVGQEVDLVIKAKDEPLSFCERKNGSPNILQGQNSPDTPSRQGRRVDGVRRVPQ